MQAYIIRRILLFLPVLLIFSVVLFLMLRVMPGDVVGLYLGLEEDSPPLEKEEADRIRAQLGFDRPIPVQYGDWIWDIVRLDLGDSLSAGRSVNKVVRQKMPVSLELGVMSLAIAYILSIPSGIFMAIRQDTWADYITRVLTLIGLATPTFWVGIMIVIILSREFGWLPPLAYVQLWDDPWVNFQQMIWPALATGTSSMAFSARITRSSMLEVLRQDYIRTAAAKGLAYRTQIIRHALRNALIPVITLFGLAVTNVASGSVIMETLFGLPGLGQEFLRAINTRDFPLVQGIALVLAGWVLGVNLLVDLLYPLIDPRVKYT